MNKRVAGLVVVLWIAAACGGASVDPKAPAPTLAPAMAAVATPASEPAGADPLANVEIYHGGLLGHEDLRSRACGSGPSMDRMYLAAERTLEAFPAALTNRVNQATYDGPTLNVSAGGYAKLPPNTAFDLLRKLTDHETHRACSLGIVRVVDAGGPVPAGLSLAYVVGGGTMERPRPQVVTGKLYVVKLDDLTSEQGAVSPATYMAQQRPGQ